MKRFWGPFFANTTAHFLGFLFVVITQLNAPVYLSKQNTLVTQNSKLKTALRDVKILFSSWKKGPREDFCTFRVKIETGRFSLVKDSSH